MPNPTGSGIAITPLANQRWNSRFTNYLKKIIISFLLPFGIVIYRLGPPPLIIYDTSPFYALPELTDHRENYHDDNRKWTTKVIDLLMNNGSFNGLKNSFMSIGRL